MSISLQHYDALGLAKLIKDKELSAKELLDHIIAKAEKFNPSLNFMSHQFHDFAYKQIADGLPNGPFKGVPFLLKNLGGLCKDTPLTDGSQLLKDQLCAIDGEVVKRFKKSGVVMFGRSNTPEFGLSFTTEPVAHGATHNPWDVNLTAGGSSGGAASAVAARVIPMAHASDGGGSIRVPASCCGLFGLKPSRARVPVGPLIGEAWGGFSTHHVLTLSVRDSAAMLDCIAGPELGDPYYAPAKTQSYLNALETPVRKLKIGFLDSLAPRERPDKPIQSSFTQAKQLLSDLGHELQAITLQANMQVMRHAFIKIATANMLNFLKQIENQREEENILERIEPITKSFVDFSKNLSASDYAEAVQTVHFHARQIALDFKDVDIILMPTTAKIARPLGELAGIDTDLATYNAKQLAFSPYTALANMTGQPAMSVPLFWTDTNIPMGTQFIAPFGDEVTLFQLARQLEEAKPWFDKIPSLCLDMPR